MKEKSESVVVVLPCLNEAKTIEWCVERALSAIAILNERHGLTGEVLVADNGSSDGSQELARAAGARVVDVPDRGYGAALLGGFGASDATYIVMGDSDCSYDFLESVAMIEKLISGDELCMGNRFKGEIKPGAMPWKNRYIGNPVLSGVLRILYSTSIGDSHCGMRAIRRDAFNQLRLSSTGMEFASEMVLKAVLNDLRIAEVPITLSPDLRDRAPHLNPWRDGLRHLVYMLLLSPKHLFLFPALVMLSLGLALFAVLLTNTGGEVVQFGPVYLGNHWAVTASALVIVAAQTAITGVLATIYSYQQGFRRPSPRALRLLALSRLERWLLVGAALIIAGMAWALSITVVWISSDFGVLDRIRELSAAATMVVTGSQIFFSGFLLSILAGNRMTHVRAI